MSDDLKSQADRVVEALTKKPELLGEVRRRLASFEASDDTVAAQLAYSVLMVEHEFGERDEGWTLHPTNEAAQAWKKEHEGPGAPGQYFSYHLRELPVTAKVWALLEEKGRLASKGNGWPPTGKVVTTAMIHR